MKQLSQIWPIKRDLLHLAKKQKLSPTTPTRIVVLMSAFLQ